MNHSTTTCRFSTFSRPRSRSYVAGRPLRLERLESRLLLTVAKFMFTGQVSEVLPPAPDFVQLGDAVSGTFQYDLAAPNTSSDPDQSGVYEGGPIEFSIDGNHFSCTDMPIFVNAGPVGTFGNTVTIAGDSCNRPKVMAINLWRGGITSTALPTTYNVNGFQDHFLFWETEENAGGDERGFSVTLDAIVPIEDVALRGFTQASTPDVLALEYEVLADGAAPIPIVFYESGDEVLDTGTDGKVPYEFTISTASLAADARLSLLGESSDAALETGTHTLLIDPTGTLLQDALETAETEIVFAAVDEAAASVPFRGVYQSEAGAATVVRTGPATADIVTVNPVAGSQDLSISFDNPQLTTQATACNPPQVIIITSGKDDAVLTSGATSSIDVPLFIMAGSGDDTIETGHADDILLGGSGNDDFRFGPESGGTDVVIDAGGTADSLDFSRYPQSIFVQLDDTGIQQVAADLKLQLGAADAIEKITGSAFADHLTGNTLKNQMHGGAGNDVLLGGDNDDELYGEDGNDLLIGQVGNDRLDGGADDDAIIGDNDSDTIIPSAGNDVLNPWQNPINPLDLNADGFIVPLDALLAINYINSHPGSSELPSDVLPPPFLDSNGDGKVFAIDVLLVINFLNARASSEGEPAGSTLAQDAFFAALPLASGGPSSVPDSRHDAEPASPADRLTAAPALFTGTPNEHRGLDIPAVDLAMRNHAYQSDRHVPDDSLLDPLPIESE